MLGKLDFRCVTVTTILLVNKIQGPRDAGITAEYSSYFKVLAFSSVIFALKNVNGTKCLLFFSGCLSYRYTGQRNRICCSSVLGCCCLMSETVLGHNKEYVPSFLWLLASFVHGFHFVNYSSTEVSGIVWLCLSITQRELEIKRDYIASGFFCISVFSITGQIVTQIL